MKVEGTTRRRDKKRIYSDERCIQNIPFLSLLRVVPMLKLLEYKKGTHCVPNYVRIVLRLDKKQRPSYDRYKNDLLSHQERKVAFAANATLHSSPYQCHKKERRV